MSSVPVALCVLTSMTGFARVDGQDSEQSWCVEARSVNGRGLDVRCRLPAGFDNLDSLVRAEAGKRLKRGSITMNVTLERRNGAPGLRLNRELVNQILALARELEPLGLAPPSLDGLLAVRGVLEISEGDSSEQHSRIETGLTAAILAALDRLGAARREEGSRLGLVLRAHLDTIAHLTEAAAACAAAQPDALRARLKAQLAALLEAAPALPEERLIHEVALQVTRVDVREELDRLRAHVAAAQALLAEDGAVGRRLDFLCQEFNREANTVCSKAADVELTRIGLALKATIEQFREQVQNIE